MKVKVYSYEEVVKTDPCLVLKLVKEVYENGDAKERKPSKASEDLRQDGF